MLRCASLAALLVGWLILCGGCQSPERGAGVEARPEMAEPPTEVIEERWPDGTLRLRRGVLRLDDGQELDHGLFTRWYANGQKEFEGQFVRGKKEGITKRWHDNGRVWIEERYTHGLKQGSCFTWDPEGRLRKEERYADGLPHGTWTVWTGDGRIKWQASFDHGQPLPQTASAPAEDGGE
ncbi:MAG: hypothetical protein PVJ57_11150 [Phycisphaerae bacterium]|jgi:hypothetical protein